MSEITNNEPMLDMYIFETTQLIEQLEQLVINGEKVNGFVDSINEIFRIMHTIKGSSAMMLFNNIAELSHAVEDLFYYLREKRPDGVDYSSLSDILLEAVDFIKNELSKIESGNRADGDSSGRIDEIKVFLNNLKGSCSETANNNREESASETQKFYISTDKIKDGSGKQRFEAVVFFSEDCEMENIRAFSIVHRLSEIADIISHFPKNVIDEDTEVVNQIRKNGFRVRFDSIRNINEIRETLEETVFLSKLELSVQNEKEDILNDLSNGKKIFMDESESKIQDEKNDQTKEEKGSSKSPQNQGIINVNISKTDRLMDLIGEWVIAEAMVTQNSDLEGLELDNFQKAARLLHKITSEVQDVVMSIRMVPLLPTFHKMHRIVRDMSKKMDKEVKLKIIGEETEVDKNIIEHISDPLMHLVRNAIDHGIETTEDRISKGKPKVGTVTLEAKNVGSDVLVIVRDDGKGLNKVKILKKARETGLIYRPEVEMTDKEIFNLIFLPGFSTKDSITEFSGRGVGMDVVTKNIEAVGGSVLIDSIEGVGSTVTLKIPLTLAIIDGMNIRVGASKYTLSTISIKESFRPKEDEVFMDPDGNEMIMVRGQCYPILRIHEHFNVKTDITAFEEGILIMVEQNDKSLCIFADELLGQQQVVVKTLPTYIKKAGKIRGLVGCTILGDGCVSLILDIGGLVSIYSSF
jgi:two-component system, chemotaxis family, sensor kinase CheA